MSEYPKVIVVDGVTITAKDAEDEARWRAKPHNPLNDVTIEMDTPADDAPPVERYDIQTDETVSSEPDAPVEEKKPRKKTPKKK